MEIAGRIGNNTNHKQKPETMPTASASTSAARKRKDGASERSSAKRARVTAGAALTRENVSSDAKAAAWNHSRTLQDRFLALFSEKRFESGVPNSALKERFGEKEYLKLVPIINELTKQSRLSMSTSVGNSKELFYSLVSDDMAMKFQGLDVAAKMVYQVIEKAGNMGCWTKDIRLQTNIQQNMMTKILKSLENRRLIKPVKSVTAKSKKLYMQYDLIPSKQLTGGVWYSDLEFDHQFISEMRSFLVYSIRRLNGGKGVTLSELHSLLTQKKVSNVELSIDEVQQLVQTLIFDFKVEEISIQGTIHDTSPEPRFVATRGITIPCDFKWWDALEPDFYFRTIQFEDSVTLAPHEPHYHTA